MLPARYSKVILGKSRCSLSKGLIWNAPNLESGMCGFVWEFQKVSNATISVFKGAVENIYEKQLVLFAKIVTIIWQYYMRKVI